MKYLAFVLLLTGCMETTQQAVAPVVSHNSQAASGVSSPSFKLPEGTGCRGAVAKFKAIVENDLETGHTTKTVHDSMMSDLGGAERACAAGQEGAAISMVRGIRAKNGYPSSLL
jgi:hypothetical protein